MSEGLKPYDEYKKADLLWLDSVPSHWGYVKIKNAFQIKKEIAHVDGLSVLSVTQQGIKVKDISKNEGQMAKDYSKYQLVNIDEFVMNHMDLLTGYVDCSKYAGVTSPDYRVFILKNINNVNKNYALYLFQLFYKARIFYGLGQGVSNLGRWRLPADSFLGLQIPLPPLPEQDQIARYLDFTLAKIARFVRAKKKLIEVLKEQIYTLTNQAITTSQSKMRLSNAVEVVRNWIERDEATKYSPVGVLNRGRGVFHKKQFQGADLGDSQFFEVEPNTLMFSGQFAWEGAVAITTESEKGCIASHRYYTARGIDSICETEYLWSFFQTKLGDLILNQCSHGAAGRNKPLNFGELLKEYVPMPDVEVQKEIARQVQLYLKYRETVTQFEVLFSEYRTRLISDVVTGKVDVRGVAVEDVVEDIEIEDLDEDIMDEDVTESEEQNDMA